MTNVPPFSASPSACDLQPCLWRQHLACGSLEKSALEAPFFNQSDPLSHDLCERGRKEYRQLVKYGGNTCKNKSSFKIVCINSLVMLMFVFCPDNTGVCFKKRNFWLVVVKINLKWIDTNKRKQGKFSSVSLQTQPGGNCCLSQVTDSSIGPNINL